jgi:hypothetical protein
VEGHVQPSAVAVKEVNFVPTHPIVVDDVSLTEKVFGRKIGALREQ